MEAHTIGLCVRIHPEFAGEVVDEGGQLWWLELKVDKSIHDVQVAVKPIAEPRAYECCKEWDRGLRGRFCYGYTGSYALYSVEDGIKLFNANSLPVAISRAMGAAYERELGGHVTYSLSIDFGRSGSVLSFKSEMEISLDDVMHFGNDLGFTVARLASEPPPVVQSAPELAESASWQPRTDSSVFEGDGRALSNSRMPVVEPAHEDEVCNGCFDETADFVLANELSPRDKYGTLAQRLARELPSKHPDVLVFGDHPGTLARALVDVGINVVGLDPKNPENYQRIPGEGGRGDRVIVNDRVSPGSIPDWLLDKKWDAVIADTTEDGEPAEVTTARNVGLVRSFNCLCIAQTRSMPLSIGSYHALELPGHGKQGCELYVAVGKWSERYPWSLGVTDGGSGVYITDDQYHHAAWQIYDDLSKRKLPMDADGWYNWVSLRHTVRAVRLAKMPSGRAVFDAGSAPELFVKLSRIYDLTERRKGDLRDLFESGRMRDVPGIPAGLLSISPTLRSGIATRYASLSRWCVATRSRRARTLDGVFANPRAGYLLEQLSEMRGQLGTEHLIAQQHRVLPYESLAVLGSIQYFKILHWYVHAVARVVGKPMHTWELQRLLFVLTSHGTHEERMAYLCMKLGDLFTRNYTGRRAPPVADKQTPLNRFLQRLDQLGMRRMYMDADPSFAQAVAGGPTTMPQPSLPVRSRRASTQASSVTGLSRGGIRGFGALA